MSVVSIVDETELVTTAEARDWCRAEASDDTFLSALIPTARELAEAMTGLALAAKTLILRMDGFPACREIELPQPPLRSVTEVKYLDEDGEEQTLSSSLYTVDKYSSPGRIVLNPYESWPFTECVPNAVWVEFEAGFSSAEREEGEPSYALPKTLRDGMRYLIAHMFSNREPKTGNSTVKEIPDFLLPFFLHQKVNW